MSAELLKPFGSYATPGPAQSVIDELQMLLDQARKGEIVGLVYGAVRPNEQVRFGYEPGTADCNRLLSAGTLGVQLLARDLLDK